MQVVLDSPVISQPTAVVFRAGLLIPNEIANLRCRFSLHRPLAVTHADGCQIGPGVHMTNPLGVVQDRVAAILLTPMTTLARLIGVMIQTGEIAVQRLQETLLDVLEEMFLVVLDREGIVPTLVHDLPGNGFLASHSVNG